MSTVENMSAWKRLRDFPTQYVRPTAFKNPKLNIVIYTTSYYRSGGNSQHSPPGIYYYFIATDSHRCITKFSFAAGNYFPRSNVTIYYKDKNEIIFIGGCDNLKHSDNGKSFYYKHIYFYNINMQMFRKYYIHTEIGGDPAVCITHNNLLHIVCGTENDYHIVYNLASHTSYKVHSFEARGRKQHALIYHEKSHRLLMFGGCSNKIDKWLNDFLYLDLSHPNALYSMQNNVKRVVTAYLYYVHGQIALSIHPNITDIITSYLNLDEIHLSQWKVDRKKRLKLPLAAFGYVLYDERVIVTFGGETNAGHNVKDIFYLDLCKPGKAWKKSEMELEHFGACNAFLINGKTVHVAPCGPGNDYKQHYSIEIDRILPPKLLSTC